MELLTQQMIDSMLSGSAAPPKDAGHSLTEIEIDALGESVNISMGAAAKALSTMINLKVFITTPEVTIMNSEDFEYKSMFPAVGVKIRYVEGLSGFNFFVIKQEDVRKIVDIMMGSTSDGEDFQFTELYTSAISEIMNQMMGASATSLASFFDRKVNISTPECVIIEENADTKNALELSGQVVVIKLQMSIGEIINSVLVSVMDVDFAKNLAENLIKTKLPPEPEPTKKEPPKAAAAASRAKPEPAAQPVASGKVAEPKDDYPTVSFANFNPGGDRGSSIQPNLDIIMDVPLEIIVQIGKTKRPVKEIIDFAQGSVIELEKQAGDPVDILVNGELIAKGDVVVIDDNFGVRITQILNN